jgi:dTDP-4-dehydrorhamnose 3,5-epimerase
VSPEVVDDQFGRLTFTTEIGRAILHLLDTGAPYGTYNLSNDGDAMTWAGSRSRCLPSSRPRRVVGNGVSRRPSTGLESHSLPAPGTAS